MFKSTDKINKAMDLLIKVAEETKKQELKSQTVDAIHTLSKLQQDYFGDLRGE